MLRLLADVHLARYQADMDDGDAINHAMTLYRHLLRGQPDLVPEGPRQLLEQHSDRPGELFTLARLAYDRFLAGAEEDLETALGLNRRALALAGPEDDTRPQLVNGLCALLCSRYERTGSQPDLDAAIDAARSAVALGGPGLPLYLSNLGVSLRDRYFATGRLADLDESVNCASRAVRDTEYPDDQASYETMLALSLRARGEATADVRDLDRAIDLLTGVVTRTPLELREAGTRLLNLQSLLTSRYVMTRNSEDLDRIVTLAAGRVAGLGTDSPMRPGAVAGHAQALRTRYDWTGDPADLHDAVASLRAAPDADEALLADLLRRRHVRFGNVADLDAAIATLEAPREPSPAAADMLSRLSMALLDRLVVRGVAADADRAVEAARSAVAMPHLNHTDRLSYLNSLTGALSTRADLRRSAADLYEAIEVMRTVVAHTPAGHRYQAVRMGNLAHLLVKRNDRASLDEAVTLATEAAAIELRRTRTEAWWFRRWLGETHAARHRMTASRYDLEAAISAYRAATRDEAASAPNRMESAKAWLALAAGDRDWPEALDAAVAAVELLPRLAWRGLARPDKERMLRREAEQLSADAAAAALHAGHPQAAVTLVERGRTVQWSQLLDARGDLASLRAVAPELADRLSHVAAMMAEAGGAKPIHR
ncbi:hypothetical protein [Micromonospora sp. NBC_00860]|uniref:hypothetical protein n=1 Tax=Micromonospora sp. NBC_00860 TaxID=2975980 RepID=UPI00386ABC98|nr:hypothetical protein OH804_04845 [Micromonospora sp. NBC_00860]